MPVIRILNDHGDQPLAVWDPADEISTEEARKRFDRLIAENYLVFRADEGTQNTGEKIKQFDPLAKIIYVFKRGQFCGG